MFLCIMNIAFIHVTFLWMNNRVLNWKPTPLGIIKPWSSYIYIYGDINIQYCCQLHICIALMFLFCYIYFRRGVV
jgi:hypothetical protein